MLLSLLQQFDIALFDFLTILFSLGLGLFFALCGLCLPLAGFVTECLYAGGGKAFYDKAAMQISQAAFASGMFIFMICGFCISAGLAVFRPDMLEAPLVWRPVICLGLPLAYLCLLGLYLVTWKTLRKLRALHLPLGLVAALCGLCLLFTGILLLSNLQQPQVADMLFEDPLTVFRNLIEDFLFLPHQWFMLAFLFLTGFAAGFGLAQLWLFMRRNSADYGRDYYAFALRFCARPAAFFALAATALGGHIFYRLYTATPQEFRQPPDMGLLVVAFALPLVSCLLWLFVVKSGTPLRHKPGAFFACLFLLIAFCAQLAALVSTFPQV